MTALFHNYDTVSWWEGMMGRGINNLLEFLDSSPSPLPCGVLKLTPQGKPSPIKGISANLINGGAFEKIPIGIFDNRPMIYRR